MLFFETRFAKYWSALMSFDLGDSFNYRRPVSELILRAAAHLAHAVSFGALLLAYLLAVPLGILSATTHRSMERPHHLGRAVRAVQLPR